MKKKDYEGFTIVNANIKVRVDLSRFEQQISRAQFMLDSQVMTDMVPYMPRRDGNFVNVTRGMSASLAGTGQVVAGASPMGRFLYYGKVMVDPDTGSPWARKDAKKVVTGKDLSYSSSDATPEWFETAKARHGKTWIENVKKTAGGG